MLPVAILAGGLGTRLWPIAANIPKALVDVDGQPFAVRQLELLRRRGITDIVYCTGHLGSSIRARLGEGSEWGLRVRYSDDGTTLLGTGGALRKALPLLGDAFFVLYGDSYLDCDYRAVERAFADSQSQGLMTVFRNEGQWDASNVEFANGRIICYDKRRRPPAMRHIDYGLGVLSAGAFTSYDPVAPLDLELVYQDVLAAGQLAAFEVLDRFFEIGTPQGLADLRQHIAATRRRS